MRGVASLLETITLTEGLPARVLAEPDGERRLTDLRHVGQLLHAAAAEEQLGVTALTAWLRTPDRRGRDRHRRRGAQPPARVRRRGGAGADDPSQQGPRVPDRLPARFCGSPATSRRQPRPVFFHDPDAGDARTIDVALEGSRLSRTTAEQYEREQRGEDLRLAYVALTRARHQAVVWWAGSYDSRNSPLARLLFCRDEHGNVAAQRQLDARRPGGRRPGFSGLAEHGRPAASRRALAGSGCRPPGARRSRPPSSCGRPRSTRGLDLRWRRTSYTDITAASHEAWVTSEPEEPLIADEPPGRPRCRPPTRPAADAAPVPADESAVAARGRCPVGGRGRHLRAPRARGDRLRRRRSRGRAGRAGRRGPGPPLGRHRRSADGRGGRAAAPCSQTPLGPGARRPAAARRRAARDRLDELGFELPLAGGDQPSGRADADADRPSVLREHLAPDDPLAGYADRLEDARLRQTRPRLPDRQPRPGGAARPGPPTRPALRRARLQDQLARRPRRAADRLALPPGGARRRDAAPPLRAAGAAVLGRAAPLPALARCPATTPTATWPASSTCSCAG